MSTASDPPPPNADPDLARDLALLREGDRLMAAGNPHAALPLFTKAGDGRLAAYAKLRRGEALVAIGEPDQARVALRRAAQLKPDDAPILFALANLDRSQGRWTDAETQYRAAMRSSPGAPEPVVNLAGMLRHLGRLDDGRALVAEALARIGHQAILYDCLGQIELDAGDAAAAEGAFRTALASDPTRATAQANLAEAVASLGRHDEAIRILDDVIPRLAEPGQARLNRAYALMASGRWAQAWADYEARFDRPAMAQAPRRPEHFALPRWHGAPIRSPVFVWGEQGLGDEILCAGAFAAAGALCHGLVIETAPRLVPLFARSFPDARVVARSLAPPPADCGAQIPAGSLMGTFGWTPETARPRPYLRAEPTAVAAAAARHRRGGRSLVGLSWASGAPRFGTAKSLPVPQLCSLVSGIDAVFLDLQYGDTAATRDAVAAATGVEIRHDDGIDLRDDIDGLAALAAACDAVVTVSNVTAHVAGALGVATHVLVPEGQARFWYWFDVDGMSPLYPQTRLHRQAGGDWGAAIAAVRDAIGG
jgi:Tfp pilus assembly protein PilF